MARPFFAETLARQQRLDRGFHALLSNRRQLLGRGWQTDQVQVQPPAQCRRRRAAKRQTVLLETRGHEGVDGMVIAGGRQFRLVGCRERPVRLVVSPVPDPPPECLDLDVGQRLVMASRRHDLLGVGGRDAANQLAFLRTAGYDGRHTRIAAAQCAVAKIQLQLSLPGLLIGAVAQRAVLGENRLHLALIIHRGIRPTVGTHHQHDRQRCPVATGSNHMRSPCFRSDVPTSAVDMKTRLGSHQKVGVLCRQPRYSPPDRGGCRQESKGVGLSNNLCGGTGTDKPGCRAGSRDIEQISMTLPDKPPRFGHHDLNKRA